MPVTWRQGRITQVTCLPEEAGCEQWGCISHSLGAIYCFLSAPLPQEMNRPGESFRMAKSLRRPSPCPEQQYGQSSDAREERRNAKKIQGCWFNDFPSCTQPPSELFPLPLCFSLQTLTPFCKGQPAMQTECVLLRDWEYLGTESTY